MVLFNISIVEDNVYDIILKQDNGKVLSKYLIKIILIVIEMY